MGIFGKIFGGGNRDPRPPVYQPPAPVVIPTAPEPILGLNVQPATALSNLPHILQTGVRHVRASWWQDSTPESWRFETEYRLNGVSVLPIILTEAEEKSLTQVSDEMWRRYNDLVDTYGPFPYIQLSNEVDSGSITWGIRGGDAFEQGRRWGTVLNIVATRIKGAHPATQIVLSSLAWNLTGVQEWFRGMILGAGGTCDIAAANLYGHGSAGEPLSRHKDMREKGWAGPIWATEVGTDDAQAAAVGKDPDTFQLEQLRACFFEDPSRLGYERIYWFQMPGQPGSSWGLMRSDNATTRPALTYLKERT